MLRHPSHRDGGSLLAVQHAAFGKLIAEVRHGGKAEVGGLCDLFLRHPVAPAKTGNNIMHIVYPDILSVHQAGTPYL